MQTLFFYGTLCHVPLLEAVLGRPVLTEELRAAKLADHKVCWVEGESFPILVEAPGQVAQGVVLAADAEALRRLDFYEGGFDYDLKQVTPIGERDSVGVYFTTAARWQPGKPWSLADYVSNYADVAVRTARAFMTLMGKVDRAEAIARLPQLRARATAGLPESFGNPDVEVLDRQRSHAGFYALDEVTLRHRRFDGAPSAPIKREGLVSVDAAIVLPYDPMRDRVLLVEQFRIGPYLRDDEFPWTLEPVAGRVDPGESPEQTAMREADEEAGVALSRVIPVSGHYPSPGLSSEFYHCFLGLCDLPDTSLAHGGVAQEGEDIRIHILEFDRFHEALLKGAFRIGPLVLLGYWLMLNRDGLRTNI